MVMVPRQYFQLSNCVGLPVQLKPGNIIFASCQSISGVSRFYLAQPLFHNHGSRSCHVFAVYVDILATYVLYQSFAIDNLKAFAVYEDVLAIYVLYQSLWYLQQIISKRLLEDTMQMSGKLFYRPQQSLQHKLFHVTSLLYHFRNKTLPSVIRPNHSPLSLVLVPPPPTVGQNSSHVGIQEWT